MPTSAGRPPLGLTANPGTETGVPPFARGATTIHVAGAILRPDVGGAGAPDRHQGRIGRRMLAWNWTRRFEPCGGSCTHGNAHDLHVYDGQLVIDGSFGVGE
jgi:hypothetical protein